MTPRSFLEEAVDATALLALWPLHSNSTFLTVWCPSVQRSTGWQSQHFNVNNSSLYASQGSDHGSDVMLRQKCSRDIWALRATKPGEVSSFSAFITLSIPSRTTASEVIRAFTEKSISFSERQQKQTHFWSMRVRRYSSPLIKCTSVLLKISNRRSYRLQIGGGLLLRTFERISLFILCFEEEVFFFLKSLADALWV